MAAKDVSLAVLAALIWGATFPISALALENTPPLFFAFLRFLCAAAFIFVFPRPNVPWSTLLALGLMLGAGQFGFLFLSMAHGISAGLASLLVHTQALITVLLAAVFFSERIHPRQAVAIIMAMGGLGLFILDKAETSGLAGLFLILIAAFCGAGGNTVLKSMRRVDMRAVAVWMSVAAPLPLLAASIVFEMEAGPASLVGALTWGTAGAVAYSAILATVVVYSIWGKLLTTYSAAQVAPFFLLVPVFGIALSAILLGERLTVSQVGGGGLIFLGLALVLWPQRPTSKRGAA